MSEQDKNLAGSESNVNETLNEAGKQEAIIEEQAFKEKEAQAEEIAARKEAQEDYVAPEATDKTAEEAKAKSSLVSDEAKEKAAQVADEAKEKAAQAAQESKEYVSYLSSVFKKPDGSSAQDKKYGLVSLIVWALLTSLSVVTAFVSVLVGAVNSFANSFNSALSAFGGMSSSSSYRYAGPSFGDYFMPFLRFAIYFFLIICVLIALDSLFSKALLKRKDSFMDLTGAYGRALVPSIVVLVVAALAGLLNIAGLALFGLLVATFMSNISLIITTSSVERFKTASFSRLYFVFIVYGLTAIVAFLFFQFIGF